MRGLRVEEVLEVCRENTARVYRLQEGGAREESRRLVRDLLEGLLGAVVGETQGTEVMDSNKVCEESSCEELNIRMAALGVPCEVLVSAVADPWLLYVQLVGPRTVALASLTTAMTEYYSIRENRQEHSVNTAAVGELVAARFRGPREVAHDFSRARVTAVEDGQVELFFLDFGDWSRTPVSEVFLLPASFLALRHQAVRCSLAGVQPLGASEWTEESADFLHWATHCSSEEVLWARLLDWRMEGGALTPALELSCRGESVARRMVKEGWAAFQ